MTEYFAHSPKDGYPAQTYAQHVNGVLNRVRSFASEAAQYSVNDGKTLLRISEIAAIYHDLGKLDQENQPVLSGQKAAKSLPVNHADAGAAFLLDDTHISILAAIAVASHHMGLPDFISESNRGDSMFRDDRVKEVVDAALPKYSQIHNSIIDVKPLADTSRPSGDLPVFLRLLLSCLVDADHTNTALHYGRYPEQEPDVMLRPVERLARLDEYVASLGGSEQVRDKLRTQMYKDCRNAEVCENIASCDSPVGSGKTTAVMAHLLMQADKRGLRRIFVVLPFTNIIQQSVGVYRDALVLPGENPEDVVAELHHRADFESEDLRHLTALWRAPIIVTTAVAFFETLASNSTSTLRRLHELPGSAIFVDEAHAALPAKYLPIAWRWLNIYADEWSCYWVLASGSLNKFWEIKEISNTPRDVPPIVSDTLRASLSTFEVKRVKYKHNLTPQSIGEFAGWVHRSPGPRIVILNTVQSAAVLAEHFRREYGRECVEHLSTALLPKDREATLKQVIERLNSSDDSNWTLIATSCVEAGVNFSFRTGFRELASLTSLLQAAGRVNRNGEYGVSEMHTFCLAENESLKSNPGLKNAAAVLQNFIEAGTNIEPSLTTKAIEREIKLYGSNSIGKKLLDNEYEKKFPFVNYNFKVIDSDTRIAVVDNAIVNNIRNGHINWCELQRNSLQIAYYKLQDLHMPQIADGIYHWNRKYDNFLGYMAGIIEDLK
ncbi:MAG: CRISPR-associated endonuclease Cas3'' [Anaerolineaceae bacterium]